MASADALVGNPKHANRRYCFAAPNALYLIYLPAGGECELDLGQASGEFSIRWFNPRSGGPLQSGSESQATGGGVVSIGRPPAEPEGAAGDWVAIVRKN